MNLLLKSKRPLPGAGSGRDGFDVSVRIYPQRAAGLTAPVAFVKTHAAEPTAANRKTVTIAGL